MSYTVIVCDRFHFADDPDHEIEVPGFLSRDDAITYARRRTRRSLEELRKPGQSPAALRDLWLTLGEDCRVVGPEGVVYRASAELEHFIRHPVPLEACDYLGWYEALLPADFALECAWSSGTVPPPYYRTYRIRLQRTGSPQADGGGVKGDILFWPDYPGPGVPAWHETFAVPTREALRIVALLHDGGFFSPRAGQSAAEPALGGETLHLTLTLRGETWPFRSTSLPEPLRSALLGEVMAAVRDAVPSRVWATLEARSQAYHAR